MSEVGAQVARLMAERDLLLFAIAPGDYAKVEAKMVAISETPDREMAASQAGAQVPSWTTRALHAEASSKALGNALRLVLMQSVDFDNSFCKLCQTKDRHADDCVSKIADEALAFWGSTQ